MGTTLGPGLLQAMLYNTNRQRRDGRLFECGMVFSKSNNELQQEMHVAGLLTGAAVPAQWGMPNRGVDFFDAKSDFQINDLEKDLWFQGKHR